MIYKKRGKVLVRINRDMPKIRKFFEERDVKKILDLGCGSGRHLVYLAKHDFLVYGIDSSNEGIRIAKGWLKRKNLKANLRVGNIFKRLPYKDDFFDALISTSVLQHAKIRDIKFAIKEIERILRPEGLIYITLPRKKFKKEEIKFKIVEPRTYLLLEGDKKGVPHYFFNKKLIKKEYKNFKFYDVWIDDWGYYAILGELKNLK